MSWPDEYSSGEEVMAIRALGSPREKAVVLQPVSRPNADGEPEDGLEVRFLDGEIRRLYSRDVVAKIR